jgi:hypothetical protein
MTSPLSVALQRRCDSCGQHTKRSLLPYEKWADAAVPCGPLGHAPTEGSRQRILEGWQRRVGTPAPCGIAPAIRAGDVHAWFPARYTVLPPRCWTVPLSHYTTSSSPA